jgi:hypothetical protein
MIAEEYEIWGLEENLGGKLNKTGVGLIWHSLRKGDIKLEAIIPNGSQTKLTYGSNVH